MDALPRGIACADAQVRGRFLNSQLAELSRYHRPAVLIHPTLPVGLSSLVPVIQVEQIPTVLFGFE
jgi:hypothetical protein